MNNPSKKMFGSVKNDAHFSLRTDIGFMRRPQLLKKKFRESYGFVPIPSLYHPVVINWIVKDCGFGEIKFYQDGNKIYCDNELMSKDFIKAILCLIVDKAILTMEPAKEKRLSGEPSKKEPRCRPIKKSLLR